MIEEGIDQLLKEIDKIGSMEGLSSAEKLERVYDAIFKRYSSCIEGEGYVYFGKMLDESRSYQYVDAICDNSQNGYISNTEAGKIINNEDFQRRFIGKFDDDIIENNYIKKSDLDSLLYNGYSEEGGVLKEGTGKIRFKDGSEARALNDAFSERYIQELKCSNVKTFMVGEFESGTGTYNAFCRTELDAIFKNDNITKINGIEKHVIEEIYYAVPESGLMSRFSTN